MALTDDTIHINRRERANVLFNHIVNMKPSAAIILASLLSIASAQGSGPAGLDLLLDIGGTFNGETATAGQFPQQVSLHGGLLRQHFCSGTILNERWILTAAHCSFLVNLLLGTWALVGTNNLSQGGQFYSIETIVSHPDFVAGTFINDIALWRTSDKIVFSVTVQPAILPTADTLGNVALTVSGWGPNNVSGASIDLSLSASPN